MTNPVLVEETRGPLVESRHRGAVAVLDAQGGVVFARGDIDAAIFPRSAVKGLQALALVASGAADRLGLGEAELALACASHDGTAAHAATAAAMLGKAGRDARVLECGAHWPADPEASRALAAAGRSPSALHNNCSGKHAGFVCLACARGDDPAGYVGAEHPTMRAVTQALAEATGCAMDARNRGTDGCSIPTYAVPLRALALAFARFATGRGLAAEHAAAAARLRRAVAAHPFMVGGADRFDTRIMVALGARAFVKGGAEGVHCAALPELGLGVAIKCDDGGGRASDVAMAAVLARLLGEDAVPADLRTPVLRNWNRIETGTIRTSEEAGAWGN